MPTYQTTAIVIGRTNFGEADRVVRLLTPDHGKVSSVAKGVRKIKSRMAGHLELFGEVNLMLATGHNLDVITSARLIWYPHHLAGDFAALPLAFSFATAIDRLVEPGHGSYKLYEALRETIHALDEHGESSALQLWFKLRLLDNLGYRPDLTGCAVCGKADAGESYALSASRGGLLCAAHAEAGDPNIPTPAIKYWRLAFDQPFATIVQIGEGETLAALSIALVDLFYEHHVGRAFRPTL